MLLWFSYSSILEPWDVRSQTTEILTEGHFQCGFAILQIALGLTVLDFAPDGQFTYIIHILNYLHIQRKAAKMAFKPGHWVRKHSSRPNEHKAEHDLQRAQIAFQGFCYLPLHGHTTMPCFPVDVFCSPSTLFTQERRKFPIMRDKNGNLDSMFSDPACLSGLPAPSGTCKVEPKFNCTMVLSPKLKLLSSCTATVFIPSNTSWQADKAYAISTFPRNIGELIVFPRKSLKPEPGKNYSIMSTFEYFCMYNKQTHQINSPVSAQLNSNTAPPLWRGWKTHLQLHQANPFFPMVCLAIHPQTSI